MTGVPHDRVTVSAPRKRAGRTTGLIWRVEVSCAGVVRARHFRTQEEGRAYWRRVDQAKQAGEAFDHTTGEPESWSMLPAAGAVTVLGHAEDLAGRLMATLKPTSRKAKVQRLAWAVAGLGPLPAGVTAGDAYQVLWRHLRGDQLTPAQVDVVRRLRQVQRPVAGVTVADAQAALRVFHERVRGSGPVSAQEQLNRRGGLSHLLNDAELCGQVARSPMRGLVTLEGSTRGRQVAAGPDTSVTLDEVGTPAQVAALLAAASELDETVGDLLAFMFETGCRPGEAWGLRGGDVAADGSQVVLRRSRTAPGSGWAGGSTETVGPLKHRKANAARPVPVDSPLVAAMLVRRAAAVGAGGSLFDVVADRPARVFKKARAAVSEGWPVEKLAVPYSLRHTHASLALNAGLPVVEVADRLGHETETLLRVYAHVVVSDRTRWTRILGSALRGE